LCSSLYQQRKQQNRRPSQQTKPQCGDIMMKLFLTLAFVVATLMPAVAQSWGRGGAYTGASLARHIAPDQECIGALGQSRQAPELGERVVENLRRVASTDKEQEYEMTT
jgi:hypothetical protein